MKGVILAAGIGSRLKSLTKDTPKALIPIAGRAMIEYAIKSLQNSKIKKIGIVIRPQDKDKFKFLHKKFDLDIDFFFQEKPKGTLKAIQKTKDFIGSDTFILSWCDTITPFDFSKIIRSHQKYKPIATLCISKEVDPSSSSQVIFDKEQILRIVEKPKRLLSSFISSAPTVLEPRIFAYFRYIHPTAKGEYHLASVLQYLINKGEIIRYLMLDTWRININTHEDIKKAEKLIAEPADPWE